MTAPARLPLSKDQLWLVKLLAKGQVEWDELDYDDKKKLYYTQIDLSYRVTDDQLSEFEDKMALKGEFGIKRMAKAAVGETKMRLTP